MCIEAWRQEGLFLGTASGGGWNDGGAAGQETEPKRHTGHMTSLRNVHKDNSKGQQQITGRFSTADEYNQICGKIRGRRPGWKQEGKEETVTVLQTKDSCGLKKCGSSGRGSV